MPAPLLLVDDDLATIAQVKRVLAREGYEMVLATNAADAVIAWGHHLPPLVLISPKVESDRGRIVLEELRSHPDAQLLHVLLLGETIPGFGYPVAALPLDPETFAQTVNELVQGTTSGDGWQVHVAPGTRTAEVPVVTTQTPREPDSWRATRKPSVPGRSEDSDTLETPEPPPDEAAGLFTTPDAAPALSPPTAELEASLFGDLEAQVAREVEAEAMASVDASLARLPIDQELQDLEDDVRAEAARRREKRQNAAAPAVGLPTPDRAAAHDEDSFAAFDEPAAASPPPPPPPGADSDDAVAARILAESQAARATLSRAEEIAHEAGAAQLAAAQHHAQLIVELDAASAERGRAEGETKQLWVEVERLETALKDATESSGAQQQRLTQDAASLNLELAGVRAQLAQSRDDLDTERAKLLSQAEAAAALELDLSQARSQGQNLASDATALDRELAASQALTQRHEEAAAALNTRLADAHGQVAEASAALADARVMLTHGAEALEAERAAARAQLTQHAEALEAEQEAARVRLRQSAEACAALEAKLAEARVQLLQHVQTSAALEAELTAARAELQEREATLELQLAQERSGSQSLEAAAEALALRLEQEREKTGELETSLAAARAELAALTAQSDELSTAAQRAAGDLREAIEEAEQSEERAQTEAAANAEAIAAAHVETQAQRARSVEAEAGLEQLRAEVEKLRQDFTAAHLAQRNLEEALEDARAANLEVRARADQAESKARVLEEKSVLPLKVPHRPPLSVTKFGTVDLGELARLVGQVVLARAEIRLELAAPGGRRTLWLSRGAVIAAESTFGGESMLDRARRDGLIDARQTTELQMVRSASPAETLTVLKERGLLREAEVVPLVQRYTEQVALDAFSEPTSEYRLAEETPGNETLAATLPRPTLPLVAEALRRALPVEELLERLGGSAAIPSLVDTELDFRALGFADKERRMLGYSDSEANVEDLALASGLKSDVAFRALLVAKLLGLIELKVPARTTVAVSPQLDVKRLEAKFEQVQESDYFTMLGLGRAAGGEEVLRAWQRLAEEFDPIKYSGHPDAGLQQRAQVVYSVLEEAAKALGDDRRRAEYARHLVD